LAIAADRVWAQSPLPVLLGEEERVAVVERIGQLLNERYIFPDTAESCAEHLRAQLEAGAFDDLTDREAFARRLTESLQNVSHDKHMRVRPRPLERATMEQENPARVQARRRDRMRRQNFGFEKVERLDGNVGYVDMRYFAGAPEARPTAVAAMNFLANADALIFDMRKNGGGTPEMIRFICSYLFDEPTHLNSLYWREGDVTEEFWTMEDVPGPKMTDVPVFVLTSRHTFSGAEEFSYNLRTRERAMLVGETTGGGANPGGTFPVNPRFEIFIPTGRAINPVTGINWEGTGVMPHVVVAADDALNTALEMAREAAEAHRAEKEAKVSTLWKAFGEAQVRAVSLADQGKTEQAGSVLSAGLRDAHDAGLVGEMDVNMLGYQLMGRDQIALAIAAFRFNVAAFPESSNVYDSLGEAYMNDGQIERAIESYEKSIELDPGNDHARAMIAEMRARG
jgi:tetratricopeptide (TPR) repeat protein